MEEKTATPIKRIYWKVEQRDAVIRKAAELKMAASGKPLFDCVIEAQRLILQPECWRSFAKSSSAAAETKMVRKRVEDTIQTLAGGVTPVATAQPPVITPIPVPIVERPTLEELIHRLAEEFAEKLTLQLTLSLRHRAEAVLRSTVNTALETDRKDKRRVMVIGTQPHQFELLQKEFGKLLDLRSGSNDTKVSTLAERAANMDYIVLWVDFISHNITESMPKDRSILVRGGMNALREKLEELYCI